MHRTLQKIKFVGGLVGGGVGAGGFLGGFLVFMFVQFGLHFQRLLFQLVRVGTRLHVRFEQVGQVDGLPVGLAFVFVRDAGLFRLLPC